MCFCQCIISVFLKKTHVAYLQFFLTFFWQTEIAKEVWGNVTSGRTKACSALTVLLYIPLWSVGRLFRHYGYARFSLCLRLYQGVILRISEHERGHIACWNCVFRMMKKYDLDASCWYTAVCTNLSFSAYSCPTERSCANTRLFWGGRTENSDWKSAGYLKSVTYSFCFTFSWRQHCWSGFDVSFFLSLSIRI